MEGKGMMEREGGKGGKVVLRGHLLSAMCACHWLVWGCCVCGHLSFIHWRIDVIHW